MQNLGKIVSMLFLIVTFANAGIDASVDSKIVSLGEMVTLNLTLTGEDIQKPNLYRICDSDIVSSSSQTSIQMVNMNYEKRYTLSYKFTPQKSCTIEPIELTIDSKVERTQPISISVQAYTQRDADFSLHFESDKKSVYVGEPFELTLLLKQKNNASAVDSKFDAPEFNGFWKKGETKPYTTNDGTFTTTKVVYTMAAQRSGVLPIDRAKIQIATRANSRDVWGSFIANLKWRTYFSNELNITALSLPNGINLVGDFTINAQVDRVQMNQNEAVNVTIKVEGDGNLEDIESFKPSLDGVNVFDEKISLQEKSLTQNIAFVSDKDFTIPSFTLRYFNVKTKSVQTITTEPIAIKVNGTQATEELIVKRQESVLEAKKNYKESLSLSPLFIALAFVGGLVIGVILMLLKPWKQFKREKKVSLKDPKVLLVRLMPFKDDAKVQMLLDMLERSIYSDSSEKIDKKLVDECTKRYLSSKE